MHAGAMEKGDSHLLGLVIKVLVWRPAGAFDGLCCSCWAVWRARSGPAVRAVVPSVSGGSYEHARLLKPHPVGVCMLPDPPTRSRRAAVQSPTSHAWSGGKACPDIVSEGGSCMTNTCEAAAEAVGRQELTVVALDTAVLYYVFLYFLGRIHFG